MGQHLNMGGSLNLNIPIQALAPQVPHGYPDHQVEPEPVDGDGMEEIQSIFALGEIDVLRKRL